MDDNLIRTILKEGFYIIKNYVKENDIHILENEVDMILDVNKEHLDKSVLNRNIRTNLNTNICNPTNSPLLHKYLNSTYIQEIASKFYNYFNISNYKKDGLFIHHDVQNEKTNNVYPHYDFIRRLKFYICVTDMTETSGCFHILKDSLNLSKKQRAVNARNNVFFKGHRLYSGTHIDLDKMTPVTAKAGDLIIFDTNCIHMGGNNFSNGRFRKVARLHYSELKF